MNQVNGIMTSFIKISLSIVIFLFTFSTQAQKFKRGTITEIIDTNRFMIENLADGVVFLACMHETKSIDNNSENYVSAIKYLKEKILNKNIFYVIENDDSNVNEVSIIYDCVPNDNKLLESDMPCLSASYLNIEFIKNKYVIYTGNNKVLKKL
ncbi:hypothetical protein C1H87_01290 [Flavivirga eckloniae]|uniref:Uncharacterized protein n=2 Tax=Flavivirga eckloniae TaxID=1803846 RepID=A0A2K9PK40_9FLAO|nr:hypothetical protein C1H87_01290 [Flavivirga eckloniae]